MLLGYDITVWTDHKNLIYPKTEHACQRVMRQRLQLEEYGVKLKHIKGEKNIIADALSRLPYNKKALEASEECLATVTETTHEDAKPIDLRTLHDVQVRHTREYNRKYEKRTDPSGLTFFTYRNCIVVPFELQLPLLKWYHEQLLHPGTSRLKESLKQNFYWKRMDEQVENSFVTAIHARSTRFRGTVK